MLICYVDHQARNTPDHRLLLSPIEQVVSMGIMEGAASVITLCLFLMAPLQPSHVGKPPTPVEEILLLWGIIFVFEVVLPEGAIAYISQKLSRERGQNKFGDVVKVLQSDLFSTQNQLGKRSRGGCALFAHTKPSPQSDHLLYTRSRLRSARHRNRVNDHVHAQDHDRVPLSDS